MRSTPPGRGGRRCDDQPLNVDLDPVHGLNLLYGDSAELLTLWGGGCSKEKKRSPVPLGCRRVPGVLSGGLAPRLEVFGPGAPPAGAGPVDRNQCFTDYVAHLKVCRDTFCPNRITNCNEAALSACITGAREVLRDCLNG
jgi:hypothetical protein